MKGGNCIRRFGCCCPSIRNINKTINKSTFNFKLSDLDEIKQRLNLKTNVSCPLGSVSSSFNIDVSSEFLLNIINFGISNSTFDDEMKSADITTIFKRHDKENYRSISCLPAGSKIFERILHKQIASYMDTYSSADMEKVIVSSMP